MRKPTCKLITDKNGYMAFRFQYRGISYWEGTHFKASDPEKRKQMEAWATIITQELGNGSFNYALRFPHGNKIHLHDKMAVDMKPQTSQTWAEFNPTWIAEKEEPKLGLRKNLIKSYKSHWRNYLEPNIGTKTLEGENRLTKKDLTDLRLWLLRDKKDGGAGVSLKTAKNVMMGTLKAMVRDADVSDNPFNKLPRNWWPALPKLEADPFCQWERDKILEHYRLHRPYRRYAIVHFRFHTGARVGEALGLKQKCVDLINGTARIEISRTENQDNLPKTRASTRTIKLSPEVVKVLKQLQPLRVQPNDYVFCEPNGRAMDEEALRKEFAGVLRTLNLRPRPFYNCRHTYISERVLAGDNLLDIAKSVGNSVAMIERHYYGEVVNKILVNQEEEKAA